MCHHSTGRKSRVCPVRLCQLVSIISLNLGKVTCEDVPFSVCVMVGILNKLAQRLWGVQSACQSTLRIGFNQSLDECFYRPTCVTYVTQENTLKRISHIKPRKNNESICFTCCRERELPWPGCTPDRDLLAQGSNAVLSPDSLHCDLSPVYCACAARGMLDRGSRPCELLSRDL